MLLFNKDIPPEGIKICDLRNRDCLGVMNHHDLIVGRLKNPKNPKGIIPANFPIKGELGIEIDNHVWNKQNTKMVTINNESVDSSDHVIWISEFSFFYILDKRGEKISPWWMQSYAYVCNLTLDNFYGVAVMENIHHWAEFSTHFGSFFFEYMPGKGIRYVLEDECPFFGLYYPWVPVSWEEPTKEKREKKRIRHREEIQAYIEKHNNAQEKSQTYFNIKQGQEILAFLDLDWNKSCC